MPAGKREKHKKEQAQKALFARMGINPEKDWEAHYEILPGKEKVVSELQKLAKNADPSTSQQISIAKGRRLPGISAK